jgi:hypothetical protein
MAMRGETLDSRLRCIETLKENISSKVNAGSSSRATALGLVEAICSGNAEEHCLIDSNGQWVGVFFDAWSETGDRWQAGKLDSLEKRAVRRFPKWATTR